MESRPPPSPVDTLPPSTAGPWGKPEGIEGASDPELACMSMSIWNAISGPGPEPGAVDGVVDLVLGLLDVVSFSLALSDDVEVCIKSALVAACIMGDSMAVRAASMVGAWLE